MTTLLRAPRIVTSTIDVVDGWIAVDDHQRVLAVGGPSDVAPRCEVARTLDGVVVPGWVDLHAHGALGHDFATCSEVEARVAAAHHRGRGTGSLVASIATGPTPDTLRALRRLAPLVHDGTLAGLHLEGPWLAGARRGAHAETLLHTPTAGEVEDMLEAGGDALRIVTLAPELPGALDAVARLVEAGVVVALGHTDADADTFRAGIDAGATLVTHLCNGMPPLHHRAPGPVGVALTDDRVLLECIVDGHHLDPVTVDLVRRAAPGRTVLVSDAMSATGCPDGDHRIAGSEVHVRGGVAMLADGSSLAGSTIAVADAAQRSLAEAVPLAEVVAAGSTRAAALLGLPVPLSPGARADFVVLDAAVASSHAPVGNGATAATGAASGPLATPSAVTA